MELSLWVSVIMMAIGVICNIVLSIFIFKKHMKSDIASILVLILIIMIEVQFILGIAFFIYNLVA